ncbi:MAG: peptide chain release factor N(5)-glutamine methyltransferase, partial [Pseudomonadota bacterium]|nr:peptide chain release factor N(5)-glutamine methyltransferase [Pseudomonadota bacterium]
MTRPRSIDAVLAEARAAGVDRLDAHWLLGHVLGRSRSWLVAHGDAALPEDRAEALDELLGRRAAGEPFAYLVGAREFHGLTLQVDPRVLVPRPETEQLVEWALE